MTDTTTRPDLVKHMAEVAEISQVAADKAFNALIEKITEDLGVGRDVSVIGFGKFTTSHRKGRMGRNPQTGEEIEIAESTVPRFKAGKKLKDVVNGVA